MQNPLASLWALQAHLSFALMLAIIALGILLFVKETFAVDVTSLLIMTLFIVTGILAPEEGFAGFTNPATVTVGCMFVLSFALFRSGVLDPFIRILVRLARWHFSAALVALLALASVLSAFINDTTVVALRLLGLGTERAVRVQVDAQGRMRADELRKLLRGHDGPTIVCAQAGNVNSGAFDPLRAIGESATDARAWLHVDGAFGLWAAASDQLRAQLDGVELAHSWATDAHKWLNVPYDCGVAFCADAQAHREALNVTAAYLVRGANEAYNEYDWVPESSRRARGFAVYAALRTLGRSGIRELVDRCCALARQMAARLAAAPNARVLNEVVLDQVVVRFARPGDDAATTDQRNRDLALRIQQDGTCWLGTTTWRGVVALRISVTNWSTTAQDIDRSADAILRCARDAGVG